MSDHARVGRFDSMLTIGGLQRIVREATGLGHHADGDLEAATDGDTAAVRDAERIAAIAELEAADERCRRAQAELAELDAMIARSEGDENRHARRAEVLQVASDQAARVSALYAAVYVRS